MKTLNFKPFLIAAFLQILFAASLFGQKYENGTRLLKGAEVLSATPLQLDYVLETLADTAKITVNLHEGKTHLVLNDGSGSWREWWYHQGRWKVKNQVVQPEIEPQVNADWDATSGIAQILNKPVIPAAQVNTDWNATSGIAQILNKPVYFPANHLRMRPATGDIHTWLQNAESGMYYVFADTQQKNQPSNPSQAAAYSYIGFKTHNHQRLYCNIIAIEYSTPSEDISNVLIKRSLGDGWSSWYHIGNGSNAATLEGKKASDFVMLNPDDGKIPSHLLHLSGQIIVQDAEPTIPDNSFAFWIHGSTFHLILRNNGTQKKVELQ